MSDLHQHLVRPEQLLPSEADIGATAWVRIYEADSVDQELHRLGAALERLSKMDMPAIWLRNYAKRVLAGEECPGWFEDPSNPGLCINCGDFVEAHR